MSKMERFRFEAEHNFGMVTHSTIHIRLNIIPVIRDSGIDPPLSFPQAHLGRADADGAAGHREGSERAGIPACVRGRAKLSFWNCCGWGLGI